MRTARSSRPGVLVVAVPPGLVSEGRVRGVLAGQGAVLQRWMPGPGLAVVRVPRGEEARVARGLRAEDVVDFVVAPEQDVFAAEVPPDEHWSSQWGMQRIAAAAAWDLAWGDATTVIAVIDSGANYEHADLAEQVWLNKGEAAADPVTGVLSCTGSVSNNGQDDDGNGYVDDCYGWDFVGQDGRPLDEFGHGTAVAGIAGARVGNPRTGAMGEYEGVAGAGRRSRLMVVRVLDGRGMGYAIDIAEAMDYAAAQGAKVINLSLQLNIDLSPSDPSVLILERAVTNAQARDVLVVAAAGNQSYNGVSFPARFAGVVAVGASTVSDDRATFSNYGERLDLLAPGEGIFSTLQGPGTTGYGYFRGTGNGTSFATPHVAGVSALVRALRPDFSQEQVYELLKGSADDLALPGFDPETGWGRLNAERAVKQAANGLGLSIVVTRTTVPRYGRSTVSMQITAPAGNPAGAGAQVALQGHRGVVGPDRVTAGADGRAVTTYIAGGVEGAGAVTATLAGLTASAPVTIAGDALRVHQPFVVR